MSSELMAVFGVGAAYAVLIFGLFGWLRADLSRTRQEFREDLIKVERGIRADMSKMERGIHEEMSKQRQEFRQDLRDSEERIIRAIAGHRHPEPDAEPVFRQPT